jgi:hypothetical protein
MLFGFYEIEVLLGKLFVMAHHHIRASLSGEITDPSFIISFQAHYLAYYAQSRKDKLSEYTPLLA